MLLNHQSPFYHVLLKAAFVMKNNKTVFCACRYMVRFDKTQHVSNKQNIFCRGAKTNQNILVICICKPQNAIYRVKSLELLGKMYVWADMGTFVFKMTRLALVGNMTRIILILWTLPKFCWYFWHAYSLRLYRK